MKDVRQEHEGIVDIKYYYLKNTFIPLLVKCGLTFEYKKISTTSLSRVFEEDWFQDLLKPTDAQAPRGKWYSVDYVQPLEHCKPYVLYVFLNTVNRHGIT